MARVGKYQALGRSLGQYKKTLYDVGAKEYQKQARAAEGQFERGMYSAVGTTIANLAGIAQERARLKELEPLDPGERPETPIESEKVEMLGDQTTEDFDLQEFKPFEQLAPAPSQAQIPSKDATVKIPIEQLERQTQKFQADKRIIDASAKQAGQVTTILGQDYPNLVNQAPTADQVFKAVEDTNQFPMLGPEWKKKEDQVVNNESGSLMQNVTGEPGIGGAYEDLISGVSTIPNYNPNPPQVEKKTKDGWVPVNNEPSASGIGGAIKGMESDKVFDMVKEGDEVNIFNPDGGTNGKDPKSARVLTDIEKHYMKEYGATIEGIDSLVTKFGSAESNNQNIRQITTEDVKKKRVGEGGGTGPATGLFQVEPDRLKVGLQRAVNFSKMKGTKVPDWVVNAKEKIAKGESFEAMDLKPKQQIELMLMDIAMRTGSDDLLNKSFAGGRTSTDALGRLWFDHWHIGPVDQDENYKKDKLAYWNRKMGRG